MYRNQSSNRDTLLSSIASSPSKPSRFVCLWRSGLRGRGKTTSLGLVVLAHEPAGVLEEVDLARRVLDVASGEAHGLPHGAEAREVDEERLLDDVPQQVLRTGGHGQGAGVLEDVRPVEVVAELGEVEGGGDGLEAAGGDLCEVLEDVLEELAALLFGAGLHEEADDGDLLVWVWMSAGMPGA